MTVTFRLIMYANRALYNLRHANRSKIKRFHGQLFVKEEIWKRNNEHARDTMRPDAA